MYGRAYRASQKVARSGRTAGDNKRRTGLVSLTDAGWRQAILGEAWLTPSAYIPTAAPAGLSDTKGGVSGTGEDVTELILGASVGSEPLTLPRRRLLSIINRPGGVDDVEQALGQQHGMNPSKVRLLAWSNLRLLISITGCSRLLPPEVRASVAVNS